MEIAMRSFLKWLGRAVERVAGPVILRPLAWVAYWLNEVLWKYHPRHTTLQLLDAASAVGAFLTLDIDAALAEPTLPKPIQNTISVFTPAEWQEMKSMVRSEVFFLNDALDSCLWRRLLGDMQHLRRPTC
jgi:hypothetical protein